MAISSVLTDAQEKEKHHFILRTVFNKCIAYFVLKGHLHIKMKQNIFNSMKAPCFNYIFRFSIKNYEEIQIIIIY